MTASEIRRAESLPEATATLVDELADAMARRWHAGNYVLVEEFLTSYPELGDEPAAVLELIAEELNLREEFGRPVDDVDLHRRFPQWHQQVGVLLDCQQILSCRESSPKFPAAGDSLAGFRLLHELGRGALGRVFLATQPALADRPVVLKVTPSAGVEHISLARLQHTNIVPLYSVHAFPEMGLRGLCMPYFGGITLAAALQVMAERPPSERAGRDFWEAIRPAGAGKIPTAASPARQFFERASYTHAVCWIGACVADALAYAKERGLLHLDLKPTNILLTADGQPMLLDFHLARGPIQSGETSLRWLGGTPEYMAPEHDAAVDAVKSGKPVPVAVAAPADVYGLGRVLFETLSGSSEGDQFPTRRWRRKNRHVSVALADVLAKCLATGPADRYPSAAALATDLRRQMADLPLRGVANRSLKERWRKWRRRRPLALPFAVLLFAFGVTGISVFEHVNRQGDLARHALATGIEFSQSRRYGEALECFKAGASLADGLPFSSELAALLRNEKRRAEIGLAARELHDLCERIRPLFGATEVPERSSQVIESYCRNVWARRREIMRDCQEPPELDRQVRADLLDLAILWSDLHTRLTAPAKLAAAQREALATLADAERLFGASCVLATEKHRLAANLGLTAIADESARRAAALPPRSAWEHYALGRALLRSGDLVSAATEMDAALNLQPQDVWPNYYRGICAFETRRYDDAVTAFSVCVALAPECAWCYLNRGIALAERGRADSAMADFDNALRLDPGLAAAAQNRGTLHLKAGRSAEALADFRLSLDCGGNAANAHYNSALAYLAQQDAPAARSSLRLALACAPEHRPAQELLARIGPADQ